MTFFLTWLAFAATQIAAAMSPGPAFILTVRHAITHGRTTGIYTAIGLGLGVAIHVGLVLVGLAAVMTQSFFLYSIIKYLGAGYLIYIGIKGLRARPRVSQQEGNDTTPPANVSLTAAVAIRSGLLTNLLNPKALVFSTSIVTQFIHPDTPKTTLLLFWLTSTTIEILWFSLVSAVLNYKEIKQRFIAASHWIDRICGGLLVGLGIKLAISKL